jgi:hypothetical protein
MNMALFKKQHEHPKISRERALSCKPVKNIQVTETRLEAGTMMLTYPVGTRPWVAALIRRFSGALQKPVTKKLELDTLGSAVWNLLDGNRTVKQVIREFSKTYQLHSAEAEMSVTQFLRQLGKRGLIGFRE